MGVHKIIRGHAIPALETLPDEGVDMLMTSVPYWNLRDYGEDTATIWGGDKDCEHDFNNYDFTLHSGRGDCQKSGKYSEQDPIPDTKPSSAYCSKCNAWRGQLGLENTPEEYINHLRMVFAAVKYVLKPTGTCWVNIGDSYNSNSGFSRATNSWERDGRDGCSADKSEYSNLPAKCMCMIPERFAFMMIDLGYILRNKIIWHKPNPMPSSVKDRFNTTYEMLYFFSKSKKYWFDLDAVREEHKTSLKERESFNYRVREAKKGHFGIVGVKSNEEEMEQYDTKGKHGVIRQSWAEETGQSESYHGIGYQDNGKNPGDFWSINTQPFPEAHFAVFPEKLCEKPILAGCPVEVCKHCGMARARITKQGDLVPNDPKYTPRGQYHGKEVHPGMTPSGKDKPHPNFHYEKETIGWSDCQCEGENKYQPGIIIDPFGGSGTVSVKAEKLGRSSILIDIKKDYCEMAIKRLKTLVEQTDLSGKQSTIQRINF